MAILQLITERMQVAFYRAEFFSLALPSFYEVFQTKTTANNRFATFAAPIISRPSQLVFSLS
jgi:hypothetical protein